ncbi:MAG TPA: hypothetical protein VFC70_05285 [Oscillospiraceae bacterium]|nr:hypothetical protein [Oscillospiraceae bacterium]
MKNNIAVVLFSSMLIIERKLLKESISLFDTASFTNLPWTTVLAAFWKKSSEYKAHLNICVPKVINANINPIERNGGGTTLGVSKRTIISTSVNKIIFPIDHIYMRLFGIEEVKSKFTSAREN